jgi:probable F420-dependent oxidoreductase
MAAIIGTGQTAWGFQLPIQSQSTIYAQPWEAGSGAAELLEITQAADRAGALYVAVCDHVAIPRPSDEAMSAVWYDTVATLSWLGAQTERVGLLSHVFVLGYRHPLVTAKAFNTLDHLTGGRAILGVGAGHLQSEFELLGADFEGRGPALNDAIEVVRAAFSEDYPTVGGPGAEVGVGMLPRPSRAGGPPIWVGGSSKAAIVRAARLSDGWLPQGPPKMGVKAAIELIHSTRAEAGLPAEFDLGVNCEPVYLGTPSHEVSEWTVVGGADEIAARLRRYVDRGMNQLQVRFTATSASEYAEQVERFGTEVAPLLSA